MAKHPTPPPANANAPQAPAAPARIPLPPGLQSFVNALEQQRNQALTQVAATEARFNDYQAGSQRRIQELEARVVQLNAELIPLRQEAAGKAPRVAAGRSKIRRVK